jgi:hypothetical protein
MQPPPCTSYVLNVTPTLNIQHFPSDEQSKLQDIGEFHAGNLRFDISVMDEDGWCGTRNVHRASSAHVFKAANVLFYESHSRTP